MTRAPRPPDEPERLKALQALRILDTAHEARFDRITRVARRVFDVPVVSIGFVDAERLWLKSVCGVSMREAGRDASICSWNILEPGPLIVPDLRQDPRWADFPTVATEPNLRFYAGVPLVSADGFRVGSFCLVDYKPRAFGDADRQLLADMAEWVQTELLAPRGRSAQLEVIFGRTRFDAHPRIEEVTRFWRREEIMRLFEDELDQARRERQPVGIMLVGVDRFAELSREVGQHRASFILSDVAQSIRFSVRPHDLLGSWGEGQILVVLSGCDLARTAVAGERIRQNRASRRIQSENGPLSVTITVAVASSSEDRDAAASRLTTAAERALALATQSGGNRTRLASIAK